MQGHKRVHHVNFLQPHQRGWKHFSLPEYSENSGKCISITLSTHLEMMIIAVSAVLAGAVCGDHISPISDTTVMSSAGAQSNHINHVTTQMQYAAVVAVVCIIGYIIAGLVQIWWVALGISLMLLLAVLTFIKKRSGSNREKTAGI